MTEQRPDIASAEPPSPPPLRMAPPEHPDAILAAARSLALDVGFRRATVADVARRAGLSRTTVYRQYEDLDAIWTALLTDELTRLVEAEVADLDELVTARERVAAMTSQVTQAVGGHPLLQRVLDLDPELLLPQIVDRLGGTQRVALAWLTEEVRAGQADGSIRGDLEAGTAAMAVLLATQSYVFSARVVEARDDEAELRRQLREMVQRYLAP